MLYHLEMVQFFGIGILFFFIALFNVVIQVCQTAYCIYRFTEAFDLLDFILTFISVYVKMSSHLIAF